MLLTGGPYGYCFADDMDFPEPDPKVGEECWSVRADGVVPRVEPI